jgi:hypothetical protein
VELLATLVYLLLGALSVFCAWGLALLAWVGLTRTSRSNCFLYAVTQYARQGGGIVVVPSRFGWWPHFMWSPDGILFYEFNPTWDKKRWRFRIPPILFTGTVRQTDLTRYLKVIGRF